MKQVQESTGRSRALKQLHQISREEATNACNVHRLAPMRQFCIDDVMLTGDIEYAKDDFYGYIYIYIYERVKAGQKCLFRKEVR